jgi:hypothetical protein
LLSIVRIKFLAPKLRTAFPNSTAVALTKGAEAAAAAAAALAGRLALVNAARPSDGITAMFTGCVHQQHTYVVPVLWLCTAAEPLSRMKVK